MSERDLTAGMKAVTESAHVAPIMFAFFDFASGPVRVWTGYGNIVMGGDTYVGTGDLGTVGNIEETAEVAAKGTSFQLSGIPSEMIALALADAYQGRAAKLWIAAMDDTGSIVADPYQIFSGRMDVIEIQDGADTSTISLSAESRLIDLNRTRERRYTDEDQKIDYPTDEGLKFISALQNRQLLWGSSRSNAGSGSNSDNGDNGSGSWE